MAIFVQLHKSPQAVSSILPIEGISATSEYPQDGCSVWCCYDYGVDALLQNYVVRCILHVIGCVMASAHPTDWTRVPARWWLQDEGWRPLQICSPSVLHTEADRRQLNLIWEQYHSKQQCHPGLWPWHCKQCSQRGVAKWKWQTTILYKTCRDTCSTNHHYIHNQDVCVQNDMYIWFNIHVLSMRLPPSLPHQAMLVYICFLFIRSALSLTTLILGSGEQSFYYKVSQQFPTRLYPTAEKNEYQNQKMSHKIQTRCRNCVIFAGNNV